VISFGTRSERGSFSMRMVRTWRAVVVPALLAYAAAVLFWTCVVFMVLGGLSLVAHLVDPGVRRSQFGGQSARLGIALGLVAAAVMYFTR
jgi:uncharacterized membrane protein